MLFRSIADGTFTYTPTSNLTLSPNTPYFIVLTAGTTIANGAYEWANSSARPVNYNPIGGWQAPVSVAAIDNYQSDNGSSWGFFFASPEYAINATAVPEPGVYVLLGLGGLCFFSLRKRSIRAQSPNKSPEPTPIALSVLPERLTSIAARLSFCR